MQAFASDSMTRSFLASLTSFYPDTGQRSSFTAVSGIAMKVVAMLRSRNPMQLSGRKNSGTTWNETVGIFGDCERRVGGWLLSGNAQSVVAGKVQ